MIDFKACHENKNKYEYNTFLERSVSFGLVYTVGYGYTWLTGEIPLTDQSKSQSIIPIPISKLHEKYVIPAYMSYVFRDEVFSEMVSNTFDFGFEPLNEWLGTCLRLSMSSLILFPRKGDYFQSLKKHLMKIGAICFMYIPMEILHPLIANMMKLRTKCIED